MYNCDTVQYSAEVEFNRVLVGKILLTINKWKKIVFFLFSTFDFSTGLTTSIPMNYTFGQVHFKFYYFMYGRNCTVLDQM